MNASARLPAATADRRRLANALRFLAIDAVEAAKSGHPGMPMGMADIAEVLWRDHMRHDPAAPRWADRDRFVLSNGHGSMLLYALLHLTGYELPLDELKRFRQLHSKTPGHPETGLTPGVETTTGPLGQGLANAVGMALAEKLLAAEFNRPELPVVDHRTYVFLGDGCLMEGVSHEVCSLAGVWKLGKLVCFYDDNGISIDGHVSGWFGDDTATRFRAYGWNVIGPIDGHDAAQIDQAIRIAHANVDAPTLVICRTTIGWGAPKMAGTHEVHGAPLGAEEAKATRAALGWDHGAFEVPADARAAWDAKGKGQTLRSEWESMFARYRTEYPTEAAEFERRMRGELPLSWTVTAQALLEQARGVTAATATRKSSQQALERLVAEVPELLGGSADLTWSNLTAAKASRPLDAAGGNYVHYGVREFGMAAIMNGAALHGGFIPYGGTFAVFSDYARSGIRMSALMKQRVVYVLTHDSIGLGEDGPTHQPVEHATALRVVPNLEVWRPCDGIETAVAWRCALDRTEGPTALLLSRQNLPQLARDEAALAGITAGGYVVAEAANSAARAVIIATGSEVAIAIDAQKLLAARGIAVRVVSMPSTTRFDAQPLTYQRSVLPPGLPRVAVEAAHPDFWRKYVGLEGRVVGVAGFGESAPAAALYEHFGLTANAVAEAVTALAVRTEQPQAA
jgi:transketolase